MKKTLLFLFCSAIMGIASAQDTIAAWTFPTSIKTPTTGLSINMGRYIGTEVDSIRPITFTSGQISGDTAATTIGWNNGVMTKYWILKFKTTGYTDIKISSKQRAGNQNGGGPKEFLLQWKMGTASWANVIDDTIRCANDWTSGVVNEAAFPAAADSSSSNISVRWVLATDLNTSGTAIDTLAVSKIDDIIITGTAITTGLTEVLYSATSINIYPNPSTGLVNIVSNDVLESVMVYNQLGAVVFEQKNTPMTTTIDLSNFGRGIYFINLRDKEGETTSKKVVIL
jgi:hypothetical protein